MSDISVVIPAHNRLVGLMQALESLYAQTIFPFEIIVIDDASHTPIETSIFDHCPREIKTQLIRNEKSLKASGARNIGIQSATGKYIAFLDDDDQFFPKKIESIIEVLKEESCPDVVYHAAEVYMINENISYLTQPMCYSEDVFYKKMLIGNCVGGTPMVIAKRNALIEAGLFDEQLPAVEDYELWLRMAKQGFTFICLKQPLTKYFYETKKNSVSKHEENNQMARDIIESLYASDIETLSFSDRKIRREFILMDQLQRSLLNYKYSDSIKLAFKVLSERFSIKNLSIFLLVLCGSNFVFRVRSWLS